MNHHKLLLLDLVYELKEGIEKLKNNSIDGKLTEKAKIFEDGWIFGLQDILDFIGSNAELYHVPLKSIGLDGSEYERDYDHEN